MPKTISIDLILSRNVKGRHGGVRDSDIADQLLRLTHVRLDREELQTIDNLDCLGPVTNLYLQHNLFTQINNLECVASTLKFLTLAGNQIKHIDHLHFLKVLQLLDLSDNLIEVFNVDHLPKSLIFLDMKNNKCTNSVGYRQSVINWLPLLKFLDGEELFDETDSDSESGSEENEASDSVGIKQTTNTLLLHSVTRLDEVAEEHRQRIAEINDKNLGPENGDREDNCTELNTDLSPVQQKISDVLQTMVKAEQDLLDNFELPNLESTPCSPTIKTDTSILKNGTSTPTPLQGDKSVTVSKPRSNKNLVTVGTTTSIAQPPSSAKPKALQERGVRYITPTSTKTRTMSPKTKSDAAKRVIRRFSSDSLVRIPGARPFHKS